MKMDAKQNTDTEKVTDCYDHFDWLRFKNTEWQLPWFVDNFKRMCAGTGCKIAIADFGMTKDMRDYADFSADWTH